MNPIDQSKPQIIRSPQEFQEHQLSLKKKVGVSTGFVPTMGALHKGHLNLIQKSIEENDRTSVSLFTNPHQFNEKSDYENYPKNLEADLLQLSSLNVDCVLCPTPEQMDPYSQKFQIHEFSESKILEGRFRPGHFQGMLTVVLQLLNLAQADRAYFGEKDFQQFFLIQKMTEAFFVPTQIIGLSTVRDSDGLALSSRNKLLSPEKRQIAPQLYKVLRQPMSIDLKIKNLSELGFEVDYLEEKWGRLLVAAKLDGVRLIDNIEVQK